MARCYGRRVRPRMTSVDDTRSEVRAWLEEHWDPDLGLVEWRSRLADSGWGCPTWPAEWYGRGLPATDPEAVAAELDRAAAVGTPAGRGIGLAAPTILDHASDDLTRRP